MIKPIAQKNNPILRRIAEPVLIENITSPSIQQVILDMKETLSHCEDGLAIAAPQIAESVRIFVVSGKFFGPKSKSEMEEQVPPGPDMVYINPEITRRSSKKKIVEEGCLSVRWFYGDTERADKVTITAFDEQGNKVTRGASGLLAQVFQHEIDHLNGALFIDSAKNIREVLPEDHSHHEHSHEGHSH